MTSPTSMEEVVASLQLQIQSLQSQLSKDSKKKIDRKIQVIADPGTFEGEKAKFPEWWTKMKVWVKANWEAFDSDFELASAVWSRMKGPTAGRYAETRMSQAMLRDTWPQWDHLMAEIEGQFQPVTEKDWAKNAISKLKQGSMRVDDFTTKWASLARQADISEEHGVYLLESHTSPEITKILYTNGLRRATMKDTMDEIRKIGQAQEIFQLHHTKPATYNYYKAQAPTSEAKTYGGRGEPMDIGAAPRGCFNCGGEHLIRNCPKPIVKCPECGWMNQKHKYACSKGKKGQIRSIDAEKGKGKEKEQTTNMDFEAQKAFFFTMYENEQKAQGKAWSS